MTKDEALKFFDEVKAQGAKDEDIVGILYLMFQDDKIDIEELEELTNLLGWEFTDEFKNMSPEDQKTKGLTPIDDAEGDEESDESEEESDESEEEEDDAEEESESEEDDEDEDYEDDEDDDDEEEEKNDKQAAKLFGFEK